MENLGSTLIKIKWQAGGESVILQDDIDSDDGSEPRPKRFDN
jgi:hypothetical protein